MASLMGSVRLPTVRLMFKNSEIKYAPMSVRDTQVVDVAIASSSIGMLSRNIFMQFPAGCLDGFNASQPNAYCSIFVRAGNLLRIVHSVKRGNAAAHTNDVAKFTVTPSQVQGSVLTDIMSFIRSLLRQEVSLWQMMEGYALYEAKAEKYLNLYMQMKIGTLFEELRSGRGQLTNPVRQIQSAANTVHVTVDRVMMDSRGCTLYLPSKLREKPLGLRLYSSQLLSSPQAGDMDILVQPGMPFVFGVIDSTGFSRGFVISMEFLQLILNDYNKRMDADETEPADALLANIDNLLDTRLYRRNDGVSGMDVGQATNTAGCWTDDDIRMLRRGLSVL